MTLRFLVVDDEYMIGQLIARALTTAYPGADVRIAHTNQQAWETLNDFVPHLITSDLYRPGGTGYEFFEQLRSDPRTEFTPVVAISGNGEREELKQYRYGFNAVLPKPFPLHELILCINRVLHLRANPDTAAIHLGFESQDRDYKEVVNLSSKAGVAALAKDVIAMANYGGGTIIVGVQEVRPGEFVPVGISEQAAEELETSRINRALRSYLDPPLAVTTRRVQDGSRLFIFLQVPPAIGTLILVANQNEKAGLYPGRIYTRTSAAESGEVRTSAELRAILENLFKRSSPNG